MQLMDENPATRAIVAATAPSELHNSLILVPLLRSIHGKRYLSEVGLGWHSEMMMGLGWHLELRLKWMHMDTGNTDTGGPILHGACDLRSARAHFTHHWRNRGV